MRIFHKWAGADMCRLEPKEIVPIAYPVFLFKRILNFTRASISRGEKRKAQRFEVGHPFPFKAVLTVLGNDSEGRSTKNGDGGVDWAGRLVNLSASGASIQVHSAAIGARGGRCLLTFSRDKYTLKIPGTIAYFRPYPQYVLCGFSFNFSNFETQKAYLQLLEPVSIGAALTPVETKKVKQDTTGLRKEQFKGPTDALLTVNRQIPSNTVNDFDFRMNAYGVRWSEGMAKVEPYGLATGKKSELAAFAQLTAAQLEEIRWLFCLAVPNLPKAVPVEIRKQLAKLVP